MTITVEALLIKIGSFLLVFIGAIVITKLLRKWLDKKNSDTTF